MDPHVDALKCLGKVCRAIPVHIIWGERKNFVYGLDIVVRIFLIFLYCSPASAQATLSEGRPMASITTMARAGHMVCLLRIFSATCLNVFRPDIPGTAH